MRDAIIPPALADAAKTAGMSPAIRAGGFLFLTGATGGLPDGTMPDSAGEQARVALSKVTNIIAHAGATEANIVEMTSYHVDIKQTFSEVEAAVHEVFASPLPAWTAVGVAELRRRGALIEFRIVAKDPGNG